MAAPSVRHTQNTDWHVKRGIKFLGIYLTLGQYDAVAALEAPRIEDAFKGPIAVREILVTETLVWVATVKHSD